MKIKLIFSLCLLCVLSHSGLAQSTDFPMNSLSASEWNLGKWKQVEEISINPSTLQVLTKAGDGTLTSNTKTAKLTSNKAFSEFKMKFELLQGENAECNLLLQGSYAIEFGSGKNLVFGGVLLNDSNVKKPKQNIAKAAGLWNEIEFSFIPAENGQVARLEYLKVNGLVVHENVFLTSTFEQNGKPNSKNSSITFENKSGTVALRNIQYLNYENKRPVEIQNLTYTLQETNSDDPDFTNTDKPAMNGKVEALSFDVPNDFTRYRLTFEGDLEVQEKNTYAFTAVYTGQGQLYIDNKLIAGGKFTKVREPQTGLVELDKGTHKFKYVYQRVWWAPVLGLYVSSGEFRPYALHASKSVPVAKEVGGIYEQAQVGNAKILRSFMMHNGVKKTEVVSVGESAGVHYSFDLESGNLLAAWKGDFADVTDMWHERGEPQLIKPLGLVNEMIGERQDFDAYMSDLYFDKYILGESGRPVFHFMMGESKIAKSFMPDEKELACKMQVDSKNTTDHIIAQGKKVEKIDFGVYKVDQSYLYIKNDVEIVEIDKDVVQLIAHVAAGKHEINYKIAW